MSGKFGVGDVPGLKSVARATAAPRVDERRAGACVVLAEEQHASRAAAWRRCRTSASAAMPSSVIAAEVVGGRGAQLGRQLGAARRAQLVGVQLEPEARVRAAARGSARVSSTVYDARLAEHVGETRQSLPRDTAGASRARAGRCIRAAVRRCSRYSSGISCAPRKVGTRRTAATAASRRITRSVLSSSSSVRPYPDFTSTVVVAVSARGAAARDARARPARPRCARAGRARTSGCRRRAARSPCSRRRRRAAPAPRARGAPKIACVCESTRPGVSTPPPQSTARRRRA